jgi:hypothetical protein
MQSRLAIAVVFVVGCVAGGAASHVTIPAARAETNPAHWEYTCIEADRTESFDFPVNELNKAGAQGWELVSMLPVKKDLGGYDKFGFCFKRPAP